MAQAVADLAHPDGRVALFNDAGMSMAAKPGDLLDAYATVTSSSRPLPRVSFAMRSGGYFGFRQKDLCLIIDSGRLGPDALMAHAHADALSFELSLADRRIVVDQGVCEYQAGPRRALARSVVSHNTLAIADADQADFFGSFRCGVRPDVRVEDYAERDDGLLLIASHDGFRRTAGGPVHRRTFELAGSRLAIEDKLDAAPGRTVTTSLLLDPACTIERGVDHVVTVKREAALLRVEASSPIRIEPAVFWPDLGVEETTNRLRIVWPAGATSGRLMLTWVIAGAPGA
jgi:uncharacterized heparinase superfamily protein